MNLTTTNARRATPAPPHGYQVLRMPCCATCLYVSRNPTGLACTKGIGGYVAVAETGLCDLHTWGTGYQRRTV